MSEADAPHRVVVVDDTPELLAMIRELLERAGHQVRAFGRASEAIADVVAMTPDLVLLDITMPEMDGYEACRRLKRSPNMAEVPVIFVSALDESIDKLRGFGAGAVDYVTKPIDAPELLARVSTQLRLRRARIAERELLELTLGGAVNSLVELVGMAAPLVDLRGRELRRIVRHVGTELGVSPLWPCELAARLSLIGCVALPQHLVDDSFAEREMSPTDRQLFDAHPSLAESWLAGIPRLELVAAILGRQADGAARVAPDDAVGTGACILRSAIAFDRLLMHGHAPVSAVHELRRRHDGHDASVLAALATYRAHDETTQLLVVPVGDLAGGMRLDEDLVTPTGTLVARCGLLLSTPILARIRVFHQARQLAGQVRVRVVDAGPAGDLARRAAA